MIIVVEANFNPYAFVARAGDGICFRLSGAAFVRQQAEDCAIFLLRVVGPPNCAY